MANNELSGPVLLNYILRYLKENYKSDIQELDSLIYQKILARGQFLSCSKMSSKRVSMNQLACL